MHKLAVYYLLVGFLFHSINYIYSYHTNKAILDINKLKEIVERKSYSKKQVVQNCLPLEFKDLLLQYRSESGYDSMYVGTTVKEAVLFPNLLWDVNDRKRYVRFIKNLTSMFEQLPNNTDPK